MTIRGLLLNGVFNSPVRCLFQTMVQFNGFYGCPYCRTPGQTVQTSERGHTLAHLFNTESENGYREPRTHESFIRCGEETKNKKTNDGKQCTVFGVSGLPLFSYLQLFNIIRVVPIDYIHCVLLGIVKMHLTLWFDKTHGNEPFSIAPRISEVDKCLHAIKTPSFITRFPRSLTKIAHFKAAELKNYSLPCLVGILIEEQFLHFSLLVFFSHTNSFRTGFHPETLSTAGR